MKSLLAPIAAVVIACGAVTASAQTQCVEAAPAPCHTAGSCHCQECGSAWEVDVRPYLWATTVKGTQYALDIPLKVDLSFHDILKNLDYAVVGEVEVRKGKFSIISDTILLKDSVAASADKTKLGPLGLTAVQGEANVNLDALSYIQSLMLGYRLCEKEMCDPCAPESPRHFSVDALVGARSWLIKTDVSVDAKVSAALPGGGTEVRSRSAKASQKMDWIDPVIGARLNYDITHKLGLRLEGDIGGFGVGSDFSWQASALMDYKICDHWTMFGGYRVLDVDYRDGAAGWDARYYGPVTGLQYKISF